MLRNTINFCQVELVETGFWTQIVFDKLRLTLALLRLRMFS